MDPSRRNGCLRLSMLAGGVGALVVVLFVGSTSVAPRTVPEAPTAATQRPPASPAPTETDAGAAPASPEALQAQRLERVVTRSAQSLQGLCGIRSTSSCADGVCAVVQDVPHEAVWVFWEAPRLLFVGLAGEVGLPDVTGCTDAMKRTDTADLDLCHYRSRVHSETPARRLLCSAYSARQMESEDVIAACNRAGLLAVRVDGVFDEARPSVRPAGCLEDEG